MDQKGCLFSHILTWRSIQLYAKERSRCCGEDVETQECAWSIESGVCIESDLPTLALPLATILLRSMGERDVNQRVMQSLVTFFVCVYLEREEGADRRRRRGKEKKRRRMVDDERNDKDLPFVLLRPGCNPVLAISGSSFHVRPYFTYTSPTPIRRTLSGNVPLLCLFPGNCKQGYIYCIASGTSGRMST